MTDAKLTYEELEELAADRRKEIDKYQLRLERIKTIVDAHKDERHDNDYGTLDERLERTLNRYRDVAMQHTAGAKSFRDDVLIWLRAMSMIVEQAGNAGTHKEKDARLRGVVEHVESVIAKLREMEFDFARRWWHGYPDTFRSDYPVREFMERAHKAEAQAKGAVAIVHQYDEAIELLAEQGLRQAITEALEAAKKRAQVPGDPATDIPF